MKKVEINVNVVIEERRKGREYVATATDSDTGQVVTKDASTGDVAAYRAVQKIAAMALFAVDCEKEIAAPDVVGEVPSADGFEQYKAFSSVGRNRGLVMTVIRAHVPSKEGDEQVLVRFDKTGAYSIEKIRFIEKL